MAVTDIKLVFLHSFDIRRLKKQSFLLLINSYIPNWGLQKMPVVIFQAWVTSGISRQNTRDEARINWIFLWIKLFYLVTTLARTIYLGKPVGSWKHWMNYHYGTKWRLIKCRLSIHWNPASSYPILPRLTSDNEMQSLFAPVRAAAIGVQSIGHAFYH